MSYQHIPQPSAPSTSGRRELYEKRYSETKHGVAGGRPVYKRIFAVVGAMSATP
jgi:hypothetical protein